MSRQQQNKQLVLAELRASLVPFMVINGVILVQAKSDGSYHDDGFDQIAWLINEINTNPNSRRLIVSGWNPTEAAEVALPPCHTLFQFFVSQGKLSCQLYQRSADVFGRTF